MFLSFRKRTCGVVGCVRRVQRVGVVADAFGDAGQGDPDARHLVVVPVHQQPGPGIRTHYRRGGLGDMVVKHRLGGVLRGVVGPTRERRAALARDVTTATQAEVHAGLGLFT